MVCVACNGEGWRHREIEHPACPSMTVTYTRVCTFCSGKGHVNDYQLCGKDRAAQSQEETQ